MYSPADSRAACRTRRQERAKLLPPAAVQERRRHLLLIGFATACVFVAVAVVLVPSVDAFLLRSWVSDVSQSDDAAISATVAIYWSAALAAALVVAPTLWTFLVSGHVSRGVKAAWIVSDVVFSVAFALMRVGENISCQAVSVSVAELALLVGYSAGLIALSHWLATEAAKAEAYRLATALLVVAEQEDAEQLMRAVSSDDEWRVMITISLKTGLRLGELLALRWKDVDLIAGQVIVRRAVARGVIGTPKSGKSREVDLSYNARQALELRRHGRSELVFCQADGALLTPRMAYTGLRHAYRRAGLRHIGWHTLRHTFASHLVMRGVPLKAIQELLGHSTIEMTLRYAHLAPGARREAVATLDLPSTGAETTVGNRWATSSRSASSGLPFSQAVESISSLNKAKNAALAGASIY